MNRRLSGWTLLVELLGGRERSIIVDRIERDFRSEASWIEAVSIANEHLVTAPFWSAISHGNLASMLPTAVVDYLAGFYELNGARNRAIERQVRECIEALNGIGVEPMPIKGSHYLLDEIYDNVADRFLSDIDLLVPTEAIDDAGELLAKMGYRPAYDRDYSGHHHRAPLVRSANEVAIELHTAAVPRDGERALPTSEVWARGRRVEDSLRFLVPAATDSVLLSFIHSEVVDRNMSLLIVPLRLLHDVHRLNARRGVGVNWSDILRGAEAIGATRELGRFLYALRSIYQVAPLPRQAAGRGNAWRMALCRAAVAHPTLLHWTLRIDRLSKRKLEAKYGATAGKELSRLRLREIGNLVRNATKSRRP